MKTTSIMLQNLCVPCACRCRYCLLSWDGRVVGVDERRGERYAARFYQWTRACRPELRFNYSFGYSMEHPDLPRALDFMRSIGSVGAAFLQCDGMRMRTDDELAALMALLSEHGVKALNYTFYGEPAYHDRFAGRAGDCELMLRAIEAALARGLGVSAGIPLTHESAPQADAMINRLEAAGVAQIRLFVPHGEGRGASLEPIRLREGDLSLLSPRAQSRLNREIYRTEAEWLSMKELPKPKKRSLIISLRPENIERFERMDCGEVIAGVEALDDAWYAALPSFDALAARYGDPRSDRLYSLRDLTHRWQHRYIRDESLSIHDVTDERLCGSRRF